MKYQVGQAVIITFSFGKQMLLVYQEKIGDYIKASGLINPKDSATVLIDSTRAATTDEILAEAQKHGWKLDTYDNYNSPSEDVYFYWHGVLEKYKISANDQQTEDYSVFGNECITAHRLITALNLAKQ